MSLIISEKISPWGAFARIPDAAQVVARISLFLDTISRSSFFKTSTALFNTRSIAALQLMFEDIIPVLKILRPILNDYESVQQILSKTYMDQILCDGRLNTQHPAIQTALRDGQLSSIRVITTLICPNTKHPKDPIIRASRLLKLQKFEAHLKQLFMRLVQNQDSDAIRCLTRIFPQLKQRLLQVFPS